MVKTNEYYASEVENPPGKGKSPDGHPDDSPENHPDDDD